MLPLACWTSEHDKSIHYKKHGSRPLEVARSRGRTFVAIVADDDLTVTVYECGTHMIKNVWQQKGGRDYQLNHIRPLVKSVTLDYDGNVRVCIWNANDVEKARESEARLI